MHSKHEVMHGYMTRTWPLKPSVPPSTRGITVVMSGLRTPSSAVSYLTSEQIIALSQRRASIESRPITMIWNCRYQLSSLSWIGQKCGVTSQPATRLFTNAAATCVQSAGAALTRGASEAIRHQRANAARSDGRSA